MATVEVTNNNTTGVVLWEPVFKTVTINVAAAKTIPAGAMLAPPSGGQGPLTDYDRAGVNSEPQPVAVVTQPLDAPAGADFQASVMVGGQVRQNKLVYFNGTDYTTVPPNQVDFTRLQDYGIVAQNTTENTFLDNQ